MSTKRQEKKSVRQTDDRRRHRRVETADSLPGQLALRLEFAVLQLSVGGMLVELEVPLPLGSEHLFNFSMQQEELEVRGSVRNCEPIVSEGNPVRYRIGIQFFDLDQRQQDILRRLVAQNL